jgi:hypothetical protein
MRRAAIALLVCATIVLAPGLRSQTAAPVLVRVDKPAIARIPAEDLAAMRALQELRVSWIALAPPELAARLARDVQGIEVIDHEPAGRAYYLIRTPELRDVEALARVRPARAIEPGISLARREAADPTEILSLGLEVVPMSAGLGETLAAAARVPPVPVIPPEMAVRDDPRIAEMVSAVSRDRLAASVRDLQSYQTRFTTAAASVAVANRLFDSFRRLGLLTVYEDFIFDGTFNKQPVPGIHASNIVATIPGSVAPERIVVLGAHYDSICGTDSPVLAPGADDNASGTAAVMEIARVFAGRSFDFTVRLVAFAAEEWGLRGAGYAAAAARQRNERIIAMVNLDMIGYTDRVPEDLNVVVNDRSQWLAVKYEGASARYAPMTLVTTVDASSSRSDHWPFWQNGYDAVFGIEDYPLANPHYHKVTDTIETLNLDFITAVTKTTLALVADLAQPSRTPAPPSINTAEAHVVRSVFTRVKFVRIGWAPPAGQQIAGYYVYRSATPHVGYERVTDAAVRDTSFTDRVPSADQTYYYVVTAVDASGRESNYSLERADDGSLVR